MSLISRFIICTCILICLFSVLLRFSSEEINMGCCCSSFLCCRFCKKEKRLSEVSSRWRCIMFVWMNPANPHPRALPFTPLKQINALETKSDYLHFLNVPFASNQPKHRRSLKWLIKPLRPRLLEFDLENQQKSSSTVNVLLCIFFYFWCFVVLWIFFLFFFLTPSQLSLKK